MQRDVIIDIIVYQQMSRRYFNVQCHKISVFIKVKFLELFSMFRSSSATHTSHCITQSMINSLDINTKFRISLPIANSGLKPFILLPPGFRPIWNVQKQQHNYVLTNISLYTDVLIHQEPHGSAQHDIQTSHRILAMLGPIEEALHF